jgi:hypothetical protein
MAQFFDRQEVDNPENGTTVTSSVELLALLDRVTGRPPFFADLIGENGFKLLLGIGEYGCVQFSSTDGNAPYLMAVGARGDGQRRETNFLIGNTPSPIPSRYLLPFAVVKEIAADFVETGERHMGVTWEDV